MAVSTNSYFSNAIVGQPQVGADIDLFDTSSLPKYQVGFGFSRGDGARFRYCHFGAIANRGNLVAKLSSETNQTKIENIGATVANLTKTGNEIMNPNAIGSRYMQLTITATANQFRGGYITITTNNGAGFTYHIKSNTATNSPVTGDCYLNLYDPIQVAIDSNSDLVIAGSPYADLLPANVNTASAATVAGVTVANQSAANYGWIQTHGSVGVLQDATIGTYGRPVTLSSATVGAIGAIVAQSNSNLLVYPPVGYLIEPASSADYSIVYLTLE